MLCVLGLAAALVSPPELISSVNALNRNQLDDARRTARAAVDADASDAGAHLQLGLVAKRQRDLAVAASALRRAVDLLPDDGAKHELGGVLSDMGYTDEQVTALGQVDNQAAMKAAGNEKCTRRSKHIAIRYHFVRQEIADKRLKLAWVSTVDQIADIFTKALPRATHAKLMEHIVG